MTIKKYQKKKKYFSVHSCPRNYISSSTQNQSTNSELKSLRTFENNEKETLLLNLHQQRTHSIPKSNWICPDCGKLFKIKKHLTCHLKKEHSFECPKCEKTFTNASHLKTHNTIHETVCPICLKIFASYWNLKDHKRSHTERYLTRSIRFLCHYCVVISTHTKGRECVRKYNTSEKLEKHLKVTHESELLLDCIDCEKGSMTFQELSTHIRTRHPELLKFKCDECEFRSKTICILKRHRQNLHEGAASKCSIEGCDYSCKGIYTGENTKRSCGIEACQYSSYRQNDLKVHTNNIHLQIRHVCESCGFEASTLSNLIGHKRNMHKDEAIKCDDCSASFISRSAIIAHTENKHRGISKKTCAIDGCQYRSIREDKLKLHIKNIHHKPKYDCENCDFKASSKGILYKHQVKENYAQQAPASI